MLFKASRRNDVDLQVEIIPRCGDGCVPPSDLGTILTCTSPGKISAFVSAHPFRPSDRLPYRAGWSGTGFSMVRYGITPSLSLFALRPLHLCLFCAPASVVRASLPWVVNTQSAPECARCMPSAYGMLHLSRALRLSALCLPMSVVRAKFTTDGWHRFFSSLFLFKKPWQ